MTVKRVLQGIFWISIYLLLTLAPLILLMVTERPPGRELWRDLSVALGFCGLSMMGLQFILTARYKFIKAPYGADIVYHFHRQISIATFVLILAHPIMLFVFSPNLLGLLNIFDPDTPWRARAGVTGLLALIVLVLISLFRKRWKIEYTRWRIWHGLLATAAVALGMVHILLVGYYVNTPLKAVFWIAYTAFWIGTLLYVRLIKPLILLRNPYRVIEVIQERGSSVTLVLEPTKGSVFRFQPGQFAWLTIWDSPFADSEHPFSISSSAEDRQQIRFTIRELGDFTSKVKNIQIGEKVYVDGPYGSFSVDRHPSAQAFVFIAGGVGITPIMSSLRTLADRGDRRPLLLLYANKTWDSIIFREELENLKARLNLKIVHVLENPPEKWDGEQGFITEEILKKYLPADLQPNHTEVFLCGPVLMMNALEKALEKIGLPAGDLHSERFDLV